MLNTTNRIGINVSHSTVDTLIILIILLKSIPSKITVPQIKTLKLFPSSYHTQTAYLNKLANQVVKSVSNNY